MGVPRFSWGRGYANGEQNGNRKLERIANEEDWRIFTRYIPVTFISISERADRIGGQLRITTQPEQGTEIFVQVTL